MTTTLANNTVEYNKTEQYENPLDISDILQICREYNKLGWHIQGQMEQILELGIEEAIEKNCIKPQSLPLIKHFLKCINDNFLLGDASQQALDCLDLIKAYEEKNNIELNQSAN